MRHDPSHTVFLDDDVVVVNFDHLLHLDVLVAGREEEADDEVAGWGLHLVLQLEVL